MSDVTEAVSQDAIAESLLGPEPTQETTAEQTQTGAEAVEQPEEFQGQETEQQTEEGNLEDWLPSEQDKVFPDEVYAKYAQRYQLSPEQSADPLLRQILHDKINADIYIQQQREQQEFQVEEPLQEPTPQQIQQPVTLEQQLQALQTWADQNTDPRAAQEFTNGFLKAFGVQEPATPQLAQAFTRNMTVFGANLIQTLLPQVLAPMLDQVMPGMSGMYYTGDRARSWDSVRNSSAEYANLPQYGSREFMELCQRLDAEVPGLTEMGLQLERANGGELYGPAAQRFYSTLAKFASNLDRPQVGNEQLLQAAQAGAASARRGQVRKDAGNLGAGQSKGLNNRSAVRSDFQTNQDLFDSDTMEYYQRQHGRI